MKRLAFVLGCCLALLGVLAQGAGTTTSTETVALREAAEQARIQRERSLQGATAATQEAACYARFAVNDCLIEVRARKREVLGDLRRQEISLRDVQRKRRAAEQLLRADDRASSRAASP